ncbi:hypothetical protein BSL78_18299 [Apostichopus japonicus]|uniref:Beta,beta-carotene 15,15'-monooxygenase n=1 Tax=Stichopus japonicus TaxID=307972 RepID=A0A2G8KA20_STIJA|nr:hypothetical protein BSL78_18299 [Apostichopus japonicus]
MIPPWLSGVYLRNGPGQFEAGDDKVAHFFDGFALMHKFEISDGKVSYSSRFLRGDAYIEATEQKRLVYSGFGTVAFPDPCKNIFSRFFSYFWPPTPSDNCNVNYLQVGEDFYALTESSKIVKIDPKDLKTVTTSDEATYDYTAVNLATAHPHYGRDGTVYNMGSSFGMQAYYKIIKFPSADLQRDSTVLCQIPASSSLYPSYYHSFGMTENYIVFVEQPLTINVLKILTAAYGRHSVADCMDYDGTRSVKFYVINREDGTIIPQTYTANAFFCFHHINAYEESGHLVVDLCCYDDISIIKHSYLSHIREGNLPNPKSLSKRFVLPLEKLLTDQLANYNLVSLPYTEAQACLLEDGSVHCSPEILINQYLELPRINYEEYNGKKYQFFYASSGDHKKLVKVDTLNKTSKEWTDSLCYTSEPVFVPNPGGEAEDDGVVLCSMIDLKAVGQSPYLVVLDATTFEELARAEIPVDIPFGIHGIFIPEIK